jgi:hypothetical protein
MKRIMSGFFGASMLSISGCTALQTVAPYAAPAKVVYCASPPEARQALRDAFGLPHLVWCRSDYTRQEVEEAAEVLGIEPPEEAE